MDSVSLRDTRTVAGLFELAVSSPLSYLAVFLAAMPILPLLPGETLVVGLGVATATI
jgi:hypothetical protein